MYTLEARANEIYAQLAAALSGGTDVHCLLKSLLEPVMRISGARSGSLHVKRTDGRMKLLGTLKLEACDDGTERIVRIPLSCRGLELGAYSLSMPADTEIGADILGFHRTLGSLLGLALHDAGAEQASRQAVLVDVHDGIAQTLAFVRMRLPVLAQAIVDRNDASALRCCDDVRVALGRAHSNLRAIMSQNHAPMDPKGLKHALLANIRSFQELTKIDLAFDDQAPDLHLSSNQEAQVFFIVQEALANIAKHSRAQHAWLNINRHGNLVDVVIEDDGAGPPAGNDPCSSSHLGLEIMRQRAARLGGDVEMAARDGGGMRVSLHFPVVANEAARTC